MDSELKEKKRFPAAIVSGYEFPEQTVAVLILGEWIRPILSNADLTRVYNELSTDNELDFRIDSGVERRLSDLREDSPGVESGQDDLPE